MLPALSTKSTSQVTNESEKSVVLGWVTVTVLLAAPPVKVEIDKAQLFVDAASTLMVVSDSVLDNAIVKSGVVSSVTLAFELRGEAKETVKEGAVTSGVNAVRFSVALSFPASSVTVTVQSEYVVPSVSVSNVMVVVPLDNEVESDVVQEPPNTNVPDSSVVTSKVGVTLVVYPFESAIWVMLIVGTVASGVKDVNEAVPAFPAISVTVTVQSEYVVPSVTVSNVMVVDVLAEMLF